MLEVGEERLRYPEGSVGSCEKSVLGAAKSVAVNDEGGGFVAARGDMGPKNDVIAVVATTGFDFRDDE